MLLVEGWIDLPGLIPQLEGAALEPVSGDVIEEPLEAFQDERACRFLDCDDDDPVVFGELSTEGVEEITVGGEDHGGPCNGEIDHCGIVCSDRAFNSEIDDLVRLSLEK